MSKVKVKTVTRLLNEQNDEIVLLRAKLAEYDGATVVEVDISKHHCVNCPFLRTDSAFGTTCDFAYDILDCPLRRGVVVVKMKKE